MANEIYERFLATRQDYIARERVASEKVDQVLLAGAAGALALSLTFLEKLAPAPHAETMWMLGLAWTALLVSLSCVLITYELRSQAYALARRELDKAQDPVKMAMKGIERCNRVLFSLKIGSLVALLAGVIFLIVFAYFNVKTT